MKTRENPAEGADPHWWALDPSYRLMDRVVARFSCGGKQRIITLYLAQVAQSRDGIRDMIELMRIAQKRYGRLYACTPGK